MARDPSGVALLDRVEAILANPAVYALAERVPKKRSESGGRPRSYPDYMLLVYEALISVYQSARQVEAELAHPLVWSLIRRSVKRRFPGRPDLHLPARPMRRHHYLYGRSRYLADPEVLEAMSALHREIAAGQARELGLMDPGGRGSWTHPHPDRILHADGKVVAPLYRAKPGDTRADKATGEVRPLRHEPDAALHFEGDGEAAWGTKFVMVAARSEDPHGRIILDAAWVPKPGGEAQVAMACFGRLAPLLPGAQGIVYDAALRGVHHQRLLREMGIMPINKVVAASRGAKAPRRRAGRRVEKSTHIEDKEVRLSDGTITTVRLYAQTGAVGVGDLTESGDLRFVPLRRIRTHRIRDKGGTFRWYNDYERPEAYGWATVTVRLHGTPEDRARGFNRTENVRAIPPSDPDFEALYARRNDSESINRGLDDSMYLGRAHSLGHLRQQVNLLGYALMVNSLALRLSRASPHPRAAPAA